MTFSQEGVGAYPETSHSGYSGHRGLVLIFVLNNVHTAHSRYHEWGPENVIRDKNQDKPQGSWKS